MRVYRNIFQRTFALLLQALIQGLIQIPEFFFELLLPLGYMFQLNSFHSHLQGNHCQKILLVSESKITGIFLHLFSDHFTGLAEYLFVVFAADTQTIRTIRDNYRY